jgi:exodeoxyribonuclease VII small subunit
MIDQYQYFGRLSSAMPRPGKEVESPAQELAFDAILDRLRQVVRQLEGGNIPLEDALKAYEEGVQLARRGHTLLEQAEKRVEVLVRGDSGELTTEPLDPERD